MRSVEAETVARAPQRASNTPRQGRLYKRASTISEAQLLLPIETGHESATPTNTRTVVPRRSSLEADFPLGPISKVAEHESWRKEVHRPATHTHKWWAQRLGTVFRALIVAAMAESREETLELYGSATRLPGISVLDPFAGSGTTLAEARKLGASVIGRDINPVATLVQRQALQDWDKSRLLTAFNAVETSVRAAIDALHVNSRGETVLYFFWVAQARCPSCKQSNDLFSSRVFGRHAYAKKNPIARALCPHCDDVTDVDLSKSMSNAVCTKCAKSFDLEGNVSGRKAKCLCGKSFIIVDALGKKPPAMRLYAKLVLAEDRSKRYEKADAFDRRLYATAASLLKEHRDTLVLPSGELEDGVNTRQAIRWNYRRWEDFFNARQLYCLGLLGTAIRDLPPSAEREALAALFSGVLEFNNLFCSYKGEGTGAVRHMFSHHILKPERLPLEAHPWGTPSSSGSFSTLFKSRLLRALDHKLSPSDLVLENGVVERVAGLSAPLTARSLEDKPHGTAFVNVRCGNSAFTGLANGSVDLVITDPPFMDNVHYSELADFFHAWLKAIEPFDSYPAGWPSTRQSGEVQSDSAAEFGAAIGHVWSEMSRVLKPGGLLAFTFHQVRIQGWVELMTALRDAGMLVTALVPIKAELSVGAPKSGAKNPSNLDSVVVCRHRGQGSVLAKTPTEAAARAERLLGELIADNIPVGETDVRSVVSGSVLALLTDGGDRDELKAVALELSEKSVERLAVQLALPSRT